MRSSLPVPVNSALPLNLTRPELIEQLGTIGAATHCCVFIASVSPDTFGGFSRIGGAGMALFGYYPPDSGSGRLGALEDDDLPGVQEQVAAALAGRAPRPHDYPATPDGAPGLRCLLRAADPVGLPAGIAHPALIGVAHLSSPDQVPSGQLDEALIFAEVFERWICAKPDELPVVEAAIKTLAATVRLVSKDCQREVAGLLHDRADVGLQLAAEIHDGICQEVTAAACALSTMTAAMDAGDHVRARKQLNLARSLIDDAMATSRRAISGLRPAALGETELPVALRRLAEQSAPTAAVHLDLDATVTLPEPARGHLYRIAQEALANVVKHASAGLVEVELLDMGNNVHLRVRDDGCGFLPRDATSHRQGSFGLQSMKGRALVLGARLEVVSSPGAGTCITLFTPKVRTS